MGQFFSYCFFPNRHHTICRKDTNVIGTKSDQAIVETLPPVQPKLGCASSKSNGT